jgi:dienelactone hydrolase
MMARLCVIGLLCVVVCNSGFGADEPTKTDLTPRAGEFMDQLSKEDFAGAVKTFDATMLKVMPAEKLKETWQALIKQVGAFQKQTGMRVEQKGKYDIVHVTCEFAKSPLDARVVFDKEKKIAGLFFAPVQQPYQAPDYVRRDAFREVEVTVGSGEWALPGTLSLPMGDGRFAAVILVHGSGPHDRDETIGPNRPFRDLAWGLASRGIVVLRYEKRTKIHGKKLLELKEFTVQQEVLDDVRLAADLLRGRKEIDEKRIYVAGHSLGASLLPRIAANDPGLAGLIALAGTNRALEDAMIEQLDYLLSLDPAMPEEQKKQIDKLKKEAAEVKTLKLKSDTPAGEVHLGAPISYWRDLGASVPAEQAKTLKQPMLILQGERDYQVTMKDFQIWKDALASRQNVTFKSYPALNHLFMAGKGKSRPAEYEQSGHVAAEVIADIAGWIGK